MTPQAVPSRRARLRAQTLAEIKEHAMAQIAQDGAEALSLNAVARAMGMSGPALYRYFASRDELLAALVGEAWAGLADALEQAAEAVRRRAPAARLRAVCGAYRAWGLAEPHRYRLALETSYGSGRFAPETTLPAATRAMAVLVDAVAALGPLPARAPAASKALGAQLDRWAGARGMREDLPPAALQLAVLAWTRLHGTVSLELVGVFAAMGLDPELLHRAEVDHLLEQLATLRGPAAGARADASPPTG